MYLSKKGNIWNTYHGWIQWYMISSKAFHKCVVPLLIIGGFWSDSRYYMGFLAGFYPIGFLRATDALKRHHKTEDNAFRIEHNLFLKNSADSHAFKTISSSAVSIPPNRGGLSVLCPATTFWYCCRNIIKLFRTMKAANMRIDNIGEGHNQFVIDKNQSVWKTYHMAEGLCSVWHSGCRLCPFSLLMSRITLQKTMTDSINFKRSLS